MSMIDNILSKLCPKEKRVRIRIQPQECDWVSIGLYINRQQRIDLIDSIENNAEIPPEFLQAFAEEIRTNRLNKDSWIEDDIKYYEKMSRITK